MNITYEQEQIQQLKDEAQLDTLIMQLDTTFVYTEVEKVVDSLDDKTAKALLKRVFGRF